MNKLTLIKDLNKTQLKRELSRHGFKAADISIKLQECIERSYLWFKLQNEFYNFIITIKYGKKKNPYTIMYKRNNVQFDKFESSCGYAYTHVPYCNGGHNCRHPEACKEDEIGYCYAFACPLASLEMEDEDTFVIPHENYKLESDKALELLWEEFGDIPMNPETECMESDWNGFPAGTHREAIWHWFDKLYSKGVAALMYP